MNANCEIYGSCKDCPLPCTERKEEFTIVEISDEE